MAFRKSNYHTYDRQPRGGPSDSAVRYDYQDRMERYHEGSKSSKFGSRPVQSNKKSSPSERNYKGKKEENFRMRKGTEVLNEINAEFKKSLLCGFESVEEIIKAKEYEDTSRSIAIPVSTRAVGFSSSLIINKISNTEANRQRLPNVTAQQIYRVQLAMVERKIFDNRITTSLDDRTLWYDPAAFEIFKTAITSINICTQQVGALIRSAGRFKYEEKNYVPMFPAPVFDRNRRFIPVPEVIYLTNLRQTVEALSNANTALDVRRNFIAKNPIPGAIFQNNVLMNANDIIPAAYGVDQLIADLYAVKAWFETATDLKSTRTKWLSNVKLTEQTMGNESMLVCNDSQTLRSITVGEVTTVTGDVDQYWMVSKLSNPMTFYGTYHLGGERASIGRMLYPMYCVRTKQACAVETKRSYQEIVLTVES